MFRIFASLTNRTLGDFATNALLVSSIRELFNDAELYVYYRNDRPYKAPIASCIWNVNGTLTPAPEASLPIDYFDISGGNPVVKDGGIENSGVRRANLVITESMLDEQMLNAIPLTTLRPPLDRIEQSDDALMKLGLDPTKWIATVYWKESDYQYRNPNVMRTITDPAPYIAVIRHIIEDLGGQVVRLGHPTSTVLPALKGLVDLAKVENSEWLQLYAVTVSRFYLASGSGPAAYGSAFGVPTVLTDMVNCASVWRAHDYIITQGVVHEGKVLKQQAAYDSGHLLIDLTADHHLVRNTAAELLAAADEMFNSTTACLGWRGLAAPPPAMPRPNAVTFPLAKRRRPDLMVPPSLRPKQP